MKKRDLIIYLVILFAIISIIGLVATLNNSPSDINPRTPDSAYTPLVPVPVPLTIETKSNVDVRPFLLISTNPDLVFTSPGNPDVTGVLDSGNYIYTFSTPNATYVEKDNIPVEFEMISFNSGLKAMYGGIYRESSNIVALDGMFLGEPDFRFYDPGLNFGGTYLTNINEMFRNSGIQTFRLQYGAKFGAAVTTMNAIFDGATSLKEIIIPKDSPFGALATQANIMISSNPSSLTEIKIPRGAQFGASLEIPDGIFTNLEAVETITFDVDSPFGQSITNLFNFFGNDNTSSLKTITFNSAFGRDLPLTGTPTPEYRLLNITASNPPDVTFVTPFILGHQWANFITHIAIPNPNVTILSPGNPITVHPQSVQDAIAANPKVTYSSG